MCVGEASRPLATPYTPDPEHHTSAKYKWDDVEANDAVRLGVFGRLLPGRVRYIDGATIAIARIDRRKPSESSGTLYTAGRVGVF